MNKPYFIEVLLNKKDNSPILLTNKNGEEFSFIKVGVKQYFVNGEHLLYCVLRAITPVDELENNQLLLYRVDDSKRKIALHYEDNPSMIDDILSTNK